MNTFVKSADVIELMKVSLARVGIIVDANSQIYQSGESKNTDIVNTLNITKEQLAVAKGETLKIADKPVAMTVAFLSEINTLRQASEFLKPVDKGKSHSRKKLAANNSLPARIISSPSEVQDIPAECQSFITDHDLATEIKLATELAKTHFSHSDSISFTLEHDPEAPDSWVAIRVTTQGTTSDLFLRSKKFSAEWVSHTLPTKRYLVRLALDVV